MALNETLNMNVLLLLFLIIIIIHNFSLHLSVDTTRVVNTLSKLATVLFSYLYSYLAIKSPVVCHFCFTTGTKQNCKNNDFNRVWTNK